MRLISGVYWDRGRREENQDSLVLEQVYTRRGRVLLAAVSDGIGGLPEGETASGFIVEKLLETFYQQALPLIGRGKGKRALQRCLLRCFFETNQLLNQYAAGKGIRLGATVSVLLIWRREFPVGHLGDSRIYLLSRRQRIRQLTQDHSDGGSGLLKCLGSFPYQRPDFSAGRILRKSGFLLCSDGFFHCLDKGILAEILRVEETGGEEQIGKRLKELAGLGIRQGETDNSTALYIRCDAQSGRR